MISFPKLESWNAATEVATIVATVNKKRVLCRIPLKILHQKYGATDDKPMEYVNKHRVAIQDAARLLIENEQYELDGSVFISMANL